jgi:hypothetical protein
MSWQPNFNLGIMNNNKMNNVPTLIHYNTTSSCNSVSSLKKQMRLSTIFLHDQTYLYDNKVIWFTRIK